MNNQRVAYLKGQVRFYTHGVQDGFPKVEWSSKADPFIGTEADLQAQLGRMIEKAALLQLPTEPPLRPKALVQSEAGLELGPSEAGPSGQQQTGNLLL